jgi:hypothetical protein
MRDARRHRERFGFPAFTASTLALLAALGWLLLVPAAGLAADTDRDGLRDGFESRWGVTDPARSDSDGDGVGDPAEDGDGDRLGNLGEQRFGTDPGHPDSDRDGRSDGREDADGDDLSNALQQDQRPVPVGLRPPLGRALGAIWGRHLDCAASPSASDLTRCAFGIEAAATRLVVMGDSKAMMWMPALSVAARASGWELVTLLKGSCSPILGTLNTQAWVLDGGRVCRRWRSRALDWLASHPPALIVLAHSDDYQLVDADGRVLSAAHRVRAWRAGVERTLDRLPASTRALVLGDVPRNARNPLRCLKGHPDDMSACVTPRQPQAGRSVEKAIRAAVGRSGRRYATLGGQVCTYDPCPLVQGRTLIWRDGGHLTTRFARQLTPSMQALLSDALAGG